MFNLSFLYFLIIFSSCIDVKSRTKKEVEVKGLLITQSISPALGPGNADFKRSDTMSVKIYFWKDQVLFQTGHMSYFMEDGQHVTKMELANFIFVYTPGSRDGYFYDLFRDKPVKKINVDSFLKYEWYAQIKIFSIFTESDSQLVSSSKDENSGILQETYSLKGRGADTLKTGSVSLFYSDKIKSPQFSLSKELDSLKGKKLVKIKTINNAREIKEAGLSLPRIEVGYTLEEIKDFKDKSIFNYFQGYSKN